MDKQFNTNYRLLFENMLNGLAYCQMLYDTQGNPEDFIYLDVNRAFYELTGLKDIIGKRVTEVIPSIKELNPEVFEIYGRVAKTGKPERFELYFKPLNFWFSISVYSPEVGYFSAVFENITERKKTEDELKARTADLEKFFQLTVGREKQMVDLKKKLQELEGKTSAA